jgi:WD40 repeat protein/class 3 adenylate cyclase
MEQLLGQLIAAERWTAVQEQAERWLSLGNTLEPAYRALMLAYGASGDIARVSSMYQRCIKELNEQFGLEPSAETRALYDGLLKGAHTPSRVVQTSGTVTFLFTDIEESTNLLDSLGNQYALVLADHHKIMRSAIRKWNGHEVDTQGDAFFVTFTRAQDAIQCSAEAQRALATHPWIHGKRLPVRMGLHTGEPLIASTGYVGMDVHRAARIGDSAHGGQVLLSQTTRELVVNDLPQGLSIRDLGEHRLKDLKFPTAIFQLVIEGLPYDFPPIRTKFTGSEPPTAGEPPFKGLQYFDEIDSELFFGREVLTAKLVNRLRDSQFLSVIIGASGSGKSSVVRAGLIPTLRKGIALLDGTTPPEGSANWQVHVTTPTAHPLEALATELTRDSESVSATATLMDDLMQDPRSLGLFLGRQKPRRHTLLVLDQFEELFTLCRDEFEREAFIDNLLTAINVSSSNAESDRKITLILTLRADFYAHLAQYPELRDAVAHQQEYIGPMTTEELRRAIEEPAKRAHWAFDPGLVDLILRDVGDEPGALPLLSHALLETWKRRAGHTLTLKGYADAGGVRGAISHTAESVFQNLSMAEQAIARNIFLRLTELGEGTEDTRRRASFDELMSRVENAEDASRVLNLLAEARLVTLSENTAEVAHEALIREWPTLLEWLNEDREGLRLHRNITEGTQEWELLEHDSGTLYRGARLAHAREWAALNPNALNAGERAFLEASYELEQHEQADREAQQRRELEGAQKLVETERMRAEDQAHSVKRLRQRAVLLMGALVLTIIAAAFAGVYAQRNGTLAVQNETIASTAQAAEDVAVNERNIAQQQALIASVRELSSEANRNLEIDPERSTLLALQAVNKTYAVDQTVLSEAEDALHRAVQASRVELTLRGHADGVWSAVFSADGTKIATAGVDGTAKIWDAATGKELLKVKSSTMGFAWYYAIFSPSGKLFATVGADTIARIWDVKTGEQLLTLKGHTQEVHQIVFSPDGSHLATISADGTSKLWDTLTGKELFTLHEEHSAIPFRVAFSPDGSQIVVANIAGTSEGWASIWDADTGQKILTLPHQSGYVRSVSFSPDGTHIVTPVDRITKIWDARDGKLLLTLYGHTDNVTDVAYSPDGRYLATASWDRQAKVWDATTGQELFILPGHSSEIWSVAFSPDGTRIITASLDGTARVWRFSPSREFLTLVNGPAIPSNTGAKEDYSPDGTRLAVAYSDQIAKVWDVTTGKLVLSLVGHTDGVNNIAYNFDGTQIATAAKDGTVKVWDAVSGKELLTLPAHDNWVLGVAFSPDGSRLVTASFDNTAKIWDVETGSLIFTLAGHTDWLLRVAFSPDGSRVVTSSFDTTAIVWDAMTGKKLFSLTGHTGAVGQVIFSPDGTRLATSSFDGSVKLWDAVSGKELRTLSRHAGSVFDISFSPDGKTIATASADKTAKLWDALTGKELLTLYAPDGLTDVDFSPDGSQLAVASRDGTTRIYLLKLEDIIALAKQRVTRPLTTEECQQYLHVDTCPAEP